MVYSLLWLTQDLYHQPYHHQPYHHQAPKLLNPKSPRPKSKQLFIYTANPKLKVRLNLKVLPDSWQAFGICLRRRFRGSVGWIRVSGAWVFGVSSLGPTGFRVQGSGFRV